MSRATVFSGKGSAVLAGAVMVCAVVMLLGCGDSGTNSNGQTHTHSYDNWTTVKDASCTETGLRTRSCSCGEIQSDTLAQQTAGCSSLYCELENNACLAISMEGVDDCNLAGGRVVTVCGSGGGAHTHSWGDWTVTNPTTCNSAGLETRTCTEDASHIENRLIPQLTGTQCGTEHTHSYGSWTIVKNASCTETGLRTRVCSCGETQSETIAQLTTGCGSGGGGTVTIDGQSYRTVEIGGLTWMAENLNRATSNSWCFGGDNANCAKYGRLYTWDAAMSACPSGWRLPTREDWNNLVTAAGGSSVAGSKLKSQTGWTAYSGISSTDEFGFSALPGGRRSTDGYFYDAGDVGYWWSATEYGSGKAYSRYVYSSYGNVDEYTFDEGDGISARCVR